MFRFACANFSPKRCSVSNDRPASAAEFARKLQACLEQLNDAPTKEAVPVFRLRGWKVAIAGLGVAAALMLLAVFMMSASETRDKSIAVLPFRNLSGDPANAYFCRRNSGRHSFPAG